MNYRHAFHAGNFADVVKHLALVAVLLHLRGKDAAFAVIDTHAGRGLYDLSSEEARRTGEAASGIGRLRDVGDGLKALSSYLGLVRGCGEEAYPGSPLLAAQLLRPQDRYSAVEMHPAEAAALAEVLKPYRKAHVECGDGYARLLALVPPPERRGVVLIDPPYEVEDEFETVAHAFAGAYRRFATGIYLVWFPRKSQAEAAKLCGEMLAAGVSKALRLDVVRPAATDDRLDAAGLLVVNPPYRFEEEMRGALAPVLPLLGAEVAFDRLAGD